MKAYAVGQDCDAPLLKWYFKLVENGDLQTAVGPSLWSLGAFMKHFTGTDMSIFYLEDEQGWWAVGWLTPFMGGAAFGVWVRTDRRLAFQGTEALNFVADLHARAFEWCPVVIAVTKQPKVLAKLKVLGYHCLDVVPQLFEGSDCHIGYITKEMFAAQESLWRSYGRDAKPS